MESISHRLGLLTTSQVADRYDISVAKVHRLILKGVLKPETKADGQTGGYYFDPAALPESIDAEPTEAAS